MEITINVPQLDTLAIAIENLANAYNGTSEGQKATSGGSTSEQTSAAPAAKKSSPSKAAPATAADEKLAAQVSQRELMVEKDPEPAQQPGSDGDIELTVADIKAKAIALTQQEGGNAKLAALFKKYGASKFSEVPEDKLGNLAGDLIAEGV